MLSLLDQFQGLTTEELSLQCHHKPILLVGQNVLKDHLEIILGGNKGCAKCNHKNVLMTVNERLECWVYDLL